MARCLDGDKRIGHLVRTSCALADRGRFACAAVVPAQRRRQRAPPLRWRTASAASRCQAGRSLVADSAGGQSTTSPSGHRVRQPEASRFPRPQHARLAGVLRLRVLPPPELHRDRDAPLLGEAVGHLPSLRCRLTLHGDAKVGVILEPFILVLFGPGRDRQFADQFLTFETLWPSPARSSRAGWLTSAGCGATYR